MAFPIIYLMLTTIPTILSQCVRDYAPPNCGSNGQIYATASDFKMATKSDETLTLRPLEECANCTEEHKPVCGSDGITYPNECLLDLFKIPHKVHDGRCVYEYTCAGEEISPVCGSDSRVYPNECELLYEKYNNNCDLENLKFFGHCCGCALVSNEQTCGSDGLFYLSKCHMDCTSKYFNKTITKEDDVINCYCDKSDNPICGSDGVTYLNRCHLIYEIHMKNKRDLYVASIGNCGQDEFGCDKGNGFVCSNENLTYKNKCVLEVATKMGLDIKYSHDGACNIDA